MNPQLIKYSRETDTSIALSRRESRKKLFNLHPQPPQAKLSPAASEMNVDPYKEQFGQRIKIRCESLKFRLQAPIDENETLCQVEPYQTSLCLFDARTGKKLTENFHFDVNHPVVRDMAKELCPASILTENDDCSVLSKELKNIPSDWIKYPKQVLIIIFIIFIYIYCHEK